MPAHDISFKKILSFEKPVRLELLEFLPLLRRQAHEPCSLEFQKHEINTWIIHIIVLQL